MPGDAAGDLAVDVRDRLRRRPCRPRPSPPSRSSTASCTPVEAPEGTAARPDAPDSSCDVDLDRRVAPRVERPAGRARLRSSRHSKLLLGLLVVVVLLAPAPSSRQTLALGGRELAPPRSTRATKRRRRPRGARARGRRSRLRATLTTVKSRSPSSSVDRVGRAPSRGRAARSRELGRELRQLLAHLRERRLRGRASRSRPRGPPLHLARVQEPGQRLGHVVEDALAALLLGLDRLPALAHAPGRLAPRRRRRRAGGGGRASRAPRAPPARGRPAPAPRAGARGSRPGRAGRRARRAASPGRRRARRRRPRRPPRRCAGRSCAAVCSRSQGQSRRSRSRQLLQLDERVGRAPRAPR